MQENPTSPNRSPHGQRVSSSQGCGDRHRSRYSGGQQYSCNPSGSQSKVSAPQQPVPVGNSQTVGLGGPVVLQDTTLHETLETFASENVLGRVVHTKGYGAFGSFCTLKSMSAYTSAGFLQQAGQRTNVFTRFSLAVSNRGTPDTSRNIWGFSTKFYTADGVFDLLANHIPVFLIRDAIKFPSAIHSLSPSPLSGLQDPSRFWEFVADNPETIHFVLWLYSDVGTTGNLRALRSYGVNTYVWKNAQGERRYVKYHWIPALPPCPLTRQEAVCLAGTSPDVAGRDLYDTIAQGEKVEYELYVQLMDPEDGARVPFDVLDSTKVWSEEVCPLHLVGRLTLDKNPDNYMEQVERSAFSPANLVEGIELSNDKMLQGRANIYWDAQRRRIGPDFRALPVNRQKRWTPSRLISSGIGQEACGVQNRWEQPWPDNFGQAGERFRSLPEMEQEHLADNIACELCLAPRAAQKKVLDFFYQCDPRLSDAIQGKIKEHRV